MYVLDGFQQVEVWCSERWSGRVARFSAPIRSRVRRGAYRHRFSHRSHRGRGQDKQGYRCYWRRHRLELLRSRKEVKGERPLHDMGNNRMLIATASDATAESESAAKGRSKGRSGMTFVLWKCPYCFLHKVRPSNRKRLHQVWSSPPQSARG